MRIRYAPYAPPAPTFSIQSNLVELAATVRDRKEQPVAGLAAADFEVLDNGKPQRVTFFSEQRAAAPSAAPPESTAGAAPATASAKAPGSVLAPPRSIALFFDDTHTQPYGLQKSKLAAAKLIDTGLHPDDLVGIFTGSGTITVDFTADRKVLHDGLSRVQQHPDRGAHGFGVCPTLTPYQAYAIAHHVDSTAKEIAIAQSIPCMCPDGDPACIKSVPGAVQRAAETVWDALRYQSSDTLDGIRAALRRLAAAPPDRIFLLMSPGFPTGDLERPISSLMDAALRGHIVVNALDADGLQDRGADPEVSRKKPIITALMSTVASSTGGRFIKNDNDLSGALNTLARPPEVSYLMGFSPAKAPNDDYHTLRVRLKNGSGYHLESRTGYFAAKTTTETETAQQHIDREVQAREQLTQIPAAFRVSIAHQPAGRFAVRVLFTIDASQLKFTKSKDRNLQQLTFVTTLEDAAGHCVAGKQAVMDLFLTEATLTRLKSRGLRATLSFDLAPGSYQVREVIREAVQNHIAASSVTVDLH